MNLLSSSPADFTLPLAVADGLVLSGIELECQACLRPYRLTRGQGYASPLGQRVALAARAACPCCDQPAYFLIVVDAERASAQVQRVSRLGLWIAQRLIALRGGRSAPTAAPVLPASRVWQREEVVCSEESLGSFGNLPIPATIQMAGIECQFVGLAGDIGSATPLAFGEHLLAPGLLYRETIDLHA